MSKGEALKRVETRLRKGTDWPTGNDTMLWIIQLMF